MSDMSESTGARKRIEITCPATGEAIGEIFEDPGAADSAVARAWEFHTEWRSRPAEERVAALETFATILGSPETVDELAAVMAAELGKPVSTGREEVAMAAGRLRALLELANDAAKSDDVPNASPIEGLQQRVDWEPLGVVGLICAWNFPVLMSCDHAVPALALGCCVVHKPSEFATMTARRLAAVFWEAGIPKEAYQIVEGGGRAGAEFAACRLGALEFIGSFSTGAAVARAAAPNHTRLGLELGGNDAFLVRADADVASCSRELAGAAFYASGQNCNGVKRVYVACEILDEFVAAFVAVARAFKVGLPDDEDTFVGPLTRGRAAVEILNHQVAASVACGARVVLGGEEALPRELSSDSYFPPTVLVDCPPHAPVMCEESFGPLVGIAAVASDEEAVSLMNDSKFGLTAGVFSKDRAASALLMAQLDVGSVYFNTAGLVEPGLPWAGRKASGVGSILGGAAGLRRSFCKSKSVYFAP